MHDFTRVLDNISWKGIFEEQYIKSRWEFDGEQPTLLSIDAVLEFLEFERHTKEGARKFMQSRAQDKKFVYYGSPRGVYWPILADSGANSELLKADFDILARSEESVKFKIGKNIVTSAHYWFIPTTATLGAIAFSSGWGLFVGLAAVMPELFFFSHVEEKTGMMPKQFLENLCAYHQIKKMSAQSETYAMGSDALTSLTRLAESRIMESLSAVYDPQHFTEITDIATASDGDYVKVVANDITYRPFSPHIGVEPSQSFDLVVDSIPIRRVQAYTWQDIQEKYKFNELPPKTQESIRFNFGLEPVPGIFLKREQNDAPVIFYGVVRDKLNPFVELLGFLYNDDHYTLTGDVTSILRHMKQGIRGLQYSKTS